MLLNSSFVQYIFLSMREQICASRSFDLDELKSRIKMPSVEESGIDDLGLCLCEYRLWPYLSA